MWVVDGWMFETICPFSDARIFASPSAFFSIRRSMVAARALCAFWRSSWKANSACVGTSQNIYLNKDMIFLYFG